MKSEERHHLKENDLEKILVNVQGFSEKHINALIWGGVIILAVLIAFFVFNRGPSESDQEAWSALLQANSVEELGKVANDPDYKNLEVSHLAKLGEARILYSRGVGLLFSDREGAVSDLKQAGENYAEILKSATDPEILERALYGQACVQETISNGDLSEAIASYEKLLTTYPSSVMNKVYTKKLERLKEGGAQALYKWMADNPAKPLDRSNPLDGNAEEATPGFGNLLNNTTDSSIKGENPEKAADNKPAEESPVEEEKSTEEKAETEEETAPEKPASEEAAPEQEAKSTEPEAAPAEGAEPAKAE